MMGLLNLTTGLLMAIAMVASVWAICGVADPEPGAWFRNVWTAVSRAPLAPREAFTPTGWRARNVALASVALAMLALLAHAFVG